MARPLTKTQLKTLKTMAMPLKPLLIIGKNNVTDAVVRQAAGLLAQKELIKIQVLADTSEVTVKEAAEDLAGQLGATVVILPMSDDECVRRAMVVADRLRAESVRSVAVDTTQRKLDKKTKAAIKAGAKWLVYIGEQELKDGRVVLKRVATGEQTELELAEAIKAVKNN